MSFGTVDPLFTVDQVIGALEVLAAQAREQMEWLDGGSHADPVDELMLELEAWTGSISLGVADGHIEQETAASVRTLLDYLQAMDPDLYEDSARTESILATSKEWQEARERAATILPLWRTLRDDLRQRLSALPSSDPTEGAGQG